MNTTAKPVERVGLTGRSRGILTELLKRRRYSEWERAGTGVATTAYVIEAYGERRGEVTYHVSRTKTTPMPMDETQTELASRTGGDWLRSVQWLVKPLNADINVQWERPIVKSPNEHCECPFCGERNTFVLFNVAPPTVCEHYIGQHDNRFVFATDDPEIRRCAKCEAWTDTRLPLCTNCDSDWCEHRGPDCTEVD